MQLFLFKLRYDSRLDRRGFFHDRFSLLSRFSLLREGHF